MRVPLWRGLRHVLVCFLPTASRLFAAAVDSPCSLLVCLLSLPCFFFSGIQIRHHVIKPHHLSHSVAVTRVGVQMSAPHRVFSLSSSLQLHILNPSALDY
ncbi:unnamed protein product [Ectocarpus fasciculatus]